MKKLLTVAWVFLFLWSGLTWALNPFIHSGLQGGLGDDSLSGTPTDGHAPHVAVTVVHHASGPAIVVRAWFYAAHNRPEEHAQIHKAVEFWNSQSGRYVYRLGRGDTAIDYPVVFELAAAPGHYDQGGFFIPAMPIEAHLLNQVQVVPDAAMARLQGRHPGSQIVGYAPSNLIYIAASHSENLAIGIHEAGHRLGAGHTHGAMDCSLNMVTQRINRHTVRDILASAGIMGRGRVEAHRMSQFRERPAHVGTPPVDFSRAGRLCRS